MSVGFCGCEWDFVDVSGFFVAVSVFFVDVSGVFCGCQWVLSSLPAWFGLVHLDFGGMLVLPSGICSGSAKPLWSAVPVAFPGRSGVSEPLSSSMWSCAPSPVQS